MRLIGAILLEQNDEWAVSRRYMSLETHAGLCDDPQVSNKAIPAARRPSLGARTMTAPTPRAGALPGAERHRRIPRQTGMFVAGDKLAAAQALYACGAVLRFRYGTRHTAFDSVDVTCKGFGRNDTTRTRTH